MKINGMGRAALAPPKSEVAELKRGALKNTVALLASNFRGVFTFLVARILGSAALGILSVSWAVTDLLTKIGMFALDNTITTFVAQAETAGDHTRSKALFRLVVVMTLLQCGLLALGTIVVIRLAGPLFGLGGQLSSAILVMICAMPGVALYRICTAVSRSMKVMSHDIYSRGITETIGTTVAFLIVLNLGATYAPQIGVVFGTTAAGLVALFLAGSLFSRTLQRPPKFSSRTEAPKLLAFSAPITAYDLLNALIVRLDVIVLGCFIGHAPGVSLATVGVYGAVVEVAGGLRKVNQIFNPIFAPVIAGMTAHGEQESAARAFAHVAQWMLWILVPVLAALVLTGPLVLSIYGPEFRQGSVWLIIVGLACGTNAFVGLAETVIMVQKPKVNLRNSIICCAVAIVGNVLLIDGFGVTGAACGILLPYLVFGLLRYRTLKVDFRWNSPLQNTYQPLLAGLVAGVPAFICHAVINGPSGQIMSYSIFLGIYFIAWRHHRNHSSMISKLGIKTVRGSLMCLVRGFHG